MPSERPMGITDELEVAISRAGDRHKHECPDCLAVYEDACLIPDSYETRCPDCDETHREYGDDR